MATRLAWVTDEAIEAVRCDDGSERLFVDGREIPLDPVKHHHATQQVINYCMSDDDGRALRRAFWELCAAFKN